MCICVILLHKRVIFTCYLNTIALLLGLLDLVIFIYGIYERVTKKPDHTLQIETSSSSQKLISSPVPLIAKALGLNI